MKKKFLLFILTSFVSVSAFSQQIDAGVKAGLNFSKLKTNEDLLKSDNSAGYLLGVWGRVGLGNVHIQPEAYFTSKNIAVNPTLDNSGRDLIKGDLKFNNIDIPVLLGTKFPVGPLNARVHAGPLFSFVINSDAKLHENVANTIDVDKLLDGYKNNFKAVVAGAGIDILKFTVDARYEHGLGNFAKSDASKQSMKIWSLSLGYKLF